MCHANPGTQNIPPQALIRICLLATGSAVDPNAQELDDEDDEELQKALKVHPIPHSFADPPTQME